MVTYIFYRVKIVEIFVPLAAHFNETKKQTCLKHSKNCLDCQVTGNIKTTQNYKPLQIYAREVSRDII